MNKLSNIGRKFEVFADLASSRLPRQVIVGSFSFGAYDAAREYAASFIPGYQLIPGGVPYVDCRRFDAICHEKQLGASIWVKEVA